MENHGRSNLTEQGLFRHLQGPTNPLKSRNQGSKAYSAKHPQALAKLSALPVSKQIGAALKATHDNQCVVLTSSNGSGKTTMVLIATVLDSLQSGIGVACTQPRILPTISVARHVVQQQEVELGQEIGYRIGFD
ncbi:hypothetical protein F5Y10DRAFT_145933 [Nemania abortiva]|nr:hypothetical protein F5Y10DRAFT_145933 [Nemania abortiva]